MEEIFERISSLTDDHPELASDLENGSATEQEICRVEEGLGRPLPISFRDYLAEFRGGKLLGNEVFGIPTPDEPKRKIMCIIDRNQSIRAQYPVEMICFSEDVGGQTYFFDTSKMGLLVECPVVMYGHGGRKSTVARGFMEFLEKLASHISFQDS